VLTRAVDPHVAGLDPRGKPVRAVEIVRPDRAGQPTSSAFTRARRSFSSVSVEHAHHRPKISSRDAHVVGHIGEYRHSTKKLRASFDRLAVCRHR
jgi:hypothetical protein